MDQEQAVTNRRIVNRRYHRRHKHVRPKRKAYFSDHYAANREKKIAAAKARNQSDRARYAAYFREYRKRKREELTNQGC